MTLVKVWCAWLALAGFLGTRSLAVAGQREQGSPASLTGFLEVVWMDPADGSDEPARVLFALVDADGVRTPLRIDDEVLGKAGGLLAVQGRRVTVTPGGTTVVRGSATPLDVTAIAPGDGKARPVAEVRPSAMTGNRKWITLLCRYADQAGFTPAPAATFREAFADAWPGLGLYWQENSFGLMNISGSEVPEWVNLPEPQSAYVVGSSFQSTKARDDCIAAAGAVDFRPFFGINMVFNGSIGGAAGFGGTNYLTLNGEARAWGVTWLSNTSTDWVNIWLFAHEMGHAFGLPHSSGPYGRLYDTGFDVMGGSACPSDGGVIRPYGCLPPHTISYHKDLLGWLPPERILRHAAGQQAVTLEPLSAPPTQSGTYQMVIVPIPGSLRFLTVERRTRERYDLGSTAEGVIIHEVDTTRGAPAQVVDGDGVAPPDDDGGRWITGETYVHQASGVTIAIASTEERIAAVTVTRPVSLTFTDDPLQPGTIVRAVHLAELRQRVAELRARRSLPNVTWTDPVLAPGSTVVKAVHVTQLQGALREVYDNAGLTPPVFSSVVRGTRVAAVHIAELRAAILAVW